MNYHDNDPSYLKMKQLINRSDPGYLNIYRFRLAFSYLRKFNIIKSNYYYRSTYRNLYTLEGFLESNN